MREGGVEGDAVARLQQLVRIPTVSRLNASETDWSQFDRFVSELAQLYPLVHARLEREVVAGHSLLFRWRGRSATEPSVLMAHYDVVAASDDGWEHPPFAAELTGEGADRLIWGRGTLDDKGALGAILEALEAALEAGHTPFHDVYLSFGHDEETAGTGARAIAELLANRGVRPALVLDEGGAIVDDAFPGVSAPVAAIGVSEKGIATLLLSVAQNGGHASTPPRVTATVRLARAIVRINDHPFPAAFTPTAIEMFRRLGVHAKGIFGFAFRNIRWTRHVLLAVFRRQSDETNAMTRTTQAVTMLNAGLAANALAERATATVNVRIALGSSVAAAVAHLRRAIHDPAVTIEVLGQSEPAPVSPSAGLAWEVLTSALAKTHPDAVVTPYVQTGATDSRSFTSISTAIYRFTPFEMSKAERDTLHAVNERMHVATYLRGIQFYADLLAAL
jgi:carboxypeptidase PM20D1